MIPDENNQGGRVRVLIAEDDVLLREGIERLLTEGGFEVVAQAADAEELVQKGRAYRPDVVVTDIRMPPLSKDDGLAAAIRLRQQQPEISVLVLSQYYEETLALELISQHPAGVGYLLKERVGDVATFLDAVRRVASGGSALDPEIVSRILNQPRASGPLNDLTPRERDVLAQMAQGKSNQGIAQDLVLSRAAIEKHVTAVMSKLNIGPTETGNRRVLAVLAYLRES
jgi:DNA-binding NarL/FixJ family response regulator